MKSQILDSVVSIAKQSFEIQHSSYQLLQLVYLKKKNESPSEDVHLHASKNHFRTECDMGKKSFKMLEFVDYDCLQEDIGVCNTNFLNCLNYY